MAIAPLPGMRILVCALAMLFLAAPKPTQPVPQTAPVDPMPGKLHPVVRTLVDTKMEAHAQDMTDLLVLVVLLEREAAAETADRIAAEPKIMESVGHDVQMRVPTDFVRMQDELSRRAKAVAAAARERDDAAMSQAFGRLTETCIGCHVRYLDSE